MGNCQNQRHLNQNQANIIEAFLAFDGSDRTQLCEEIWNVASPKVDYYWRDGTFDALEELRTKELYNRKYGNGRLLVIMTLQVSSEESMPIRQLYY
ncbi:MAG: hypothetical protein II866_05380 [Prevotella sp.]|nr:hypothetical protein [Prevotella sp.]